MDHPERGLATRPVPELKSGVVPLPPHVRSLRNAANEVLQAEDVKDIMRKIIAQAKSGDVKSARFVMDYFLGGPAGAVVFVQNNFGKPLRSGDGE